MPNEPDYDAYLAVISTMATGDAFFRALQAKVASGHIIQQVTLSIGPGPRAAYRFVLARLGTLSGQEVPAGEPAVEAFLDGRGQVMATVDDEARRCFVRLNRAMFTMFHTVANLRGSALRGMVERIGPPQSLVQARLRFPQVSATGPLVEVVVRALLGEFADELLRLHRLAYPAHTAASIADQGLCELIDAT